jgi:hypothetical protein
MYVCMYIYIYIRIYMHKYIHQKISKVSTLVYFIFIESRHVEDFSVICNPRRRKWRRGALGMSSWLEMFFLDKSQHPSIIFTF